MLCIRFPLRLYTILVAGSFAISMFATDGVATNPNPSETLNFVLASLEARDQLLSNCKIKFTEEAEAIMRADGVRALASYKVAEFRRTPSTMWIHVLSYQADTKQDRVVDDSTANWDGHICRGVGNPPYNGTTYHHCIVNTRENEFFTNLRYFEVLGSRVSLDSQKLTLSAQVRYYIEKGWKVAVSSHLLGGLPMTCIDLDTESEHYRVWLDPAKGYMAVGSDCVVIPAKRVISVVHRVKESSLISNVWVPMRTVRTIDNVNTEYTTEEVFTVTSASIGSTTERDVAVDFPVDSEVMDTVNNTAYFVRAGGKFELKPFADTGARVIHQPPERAIVAKMDVAVGKSYILEPMLSSAPETPQRSSAKKWYLTGLSLFALIGGAIAWYRRAGHSQKVG